MATATLRPEDRYAFVGKTGSGKTALAAVLAATFARTLPPPWQVWWFDTKNVPEDLAMLRRWGFRNASSLDDQRPETGGLQNALYFIIKEAGKTHTTVDQVQALCREAYERGNVIIVVDEYTQVVPSARSAGQSLQDVFTRGRGRKVGIIGLTQEPVYVPRQLISQATHVCLLTLSYQNDIKYVKNFCPIYVPPLSIGDKYGFFWSHVDGMGEWDYYPNQRKWFDKLVAATPQIQAEAEAEQATA